MATVSGACAAEAGLRPAKGASLPAPYAREAALSPLGYFEQQ
jgi:hypothetical protein